MQTLLTFTLVALAAVPGPSAADDDCAAEYFNIGKCCNFTAIYPSTAMNSALACKEKYVSGKSYGSPAEKKAVFSCFVECVASMEALLTTDKQLDKSAIMKYFSASDPAVTEKVQRCLGSNEVDIDPSQECRSGALEFKKCLKINFFLDCPSSMWQGSSECEEVKQKVIKCPEVPLRISHS